jgi:hypothetical protein
VFRVDESIALGLLLLPEVRPLAHEPSRVWLDRVGQWVKANREHPSASRLIRQRRADGGIAIGWTLAWAMSGFQRILVGHKLAASLMATHAGDDPEVMTCRPWDAYTIEVPPELVRVNVTGRPASFDVVAVWHHPPDAMSYFMVLGRESDMVISGKLVFPLPAFDVGALSALPDADGGPVIRARDCFARLVVSTELEMTDPSRVKAPPAHRRTAGDGTAPAGVHRLLREVKVDCREAIASYIAGQRRAPPSVRTLVQGHFKRVVHGPGRTGRRWQQIEPHWRGPEKAPVAVRPHRLPEDG